MGRSEAYPQFQLLFLKRRLKRRLIKRFRRLRLRRQKGKSIEGSGVEMNEQTQLAHDRLLRKKEAAERLACSTRTVDREASCGRLKRVKVRGGVRFRESEVQAIINGGEL